MKKTNKGDVMIINGIQLINCYNLSPDEAMSKLRQAVINEGFEYKGQITLNSRNFLLLIKK